MKIINFFNNNQIALQNKKLLVAASAGPDSMALLDLLVNLQKKLDFTVMAAHFDHQLREDSALETKVLKHYCKLKHVPLFVDKWDKEKHPQVGLEAAARDVRYDFLTKTAKENDVDYLLTAHHGDDLLENILLKFIRSGNPEEMNSLQRMGKMHGVVLLRPLLAYSKQELLEYDQQQGIDFIIDSTNQEDETMRNRLRHHIIPLLKQENPLIVQNALVFSQKMRHLTTWIDSQVAKIGKVKLFLDSYRLKRQKLAGLTTDEQVIFWQKIIWQKYHLRVNENLGNFLLVEYQGYVYLIENKHRELIPPFRINLDQSFEFNGRHFLLTTEENTGLLQIGDFWLADQPDFSAGSLSLGSKLLLKNGSRVKAKKKFAENAIPLPLRPLCVTIYDKGEPVFVENCYQKQDFLSNGQHYFLYIF